MREFRRSIACVLLLWSFRAGGKYWSVEILQAYAILQKAIKRELDAEKMNRMTSDATGSDQ
jgi:hypothetical protein